MVAIYTLLKGAILRGSGDGAGINIGVRGSVGGPAEGGGGAAGLYWFLNTWRETP